jgi:exopolyphosphatase/pppGpp-phosphohydrolase
LPSLALRVGVLRDLLPRRQYGLQWGPLSYLIQPSGGDQRAERKGAEKTMSDAFTYDVFLSHNQHDKPRVRELAERLREAGLRVWLDEWVVKAGDIIALAVEEGLEQSRTLVLCLSAHALASDWVKLERSTAIHRDPANTARRFIPLLHQAFDRKL